MTSPSGARRSRLSRDLAAGAPIGRRVVLGMLGLGAAGVVWGASVQRATGRLLSVLPGGDQFRIYSVAGFEPDTSDSAYRLSVEGLVDQPLDLGLDDLRAMPASKLVRDFQCVTGWRVPSVEWTGVRLADLLDRAGVTEDAAAVLFQSADGVYTESLTLEQARRSDVLVAYGMQDQPLSREHGGPVRLYVAPMYGYKSCKWLNGIRVARQEVPGYWEQQGWDINAWVGGSNGRTDAPTS